VGVLWSLQAGFQQEDPNDEYKECEDEDETVLDDIKDDVDANRKLLNTMPAYNQILNAKVLLQLGDKMAIGKVTQQSFGYDGQTAGTYGKKKKNIYIYYLSSCHRAIPLVLPQCEDGTT
jgi:hypothetical protein